jgi:hypothetical protein
MHRVVRDLVQHLVVEAIDRLQFRYGQRRRLVGGEAVTRTIGRVEVDKKL